MKVINYIKIIHVKGFTLVEVVCVMLLLGVVGLLSTRLFGNMVQGYTLARESDAAVQKAQNAMQRMTIDFTYMLVAASSGTTNTITYKTSLDSASQISIYQAGDTIYYALGGGNYPLTDGVKNGSLQFFYYDTYGSAAGNTLNPGTALVGISYTMVGNAVSPGFSQTYSTRVKVGKL